MPVHPPFAASSTLEAQPDPHSRATLAAPSSANTSSKGSGTGEQSVIEQWRRVRSVLLVLGLIACVMVWILPSFCGPPDERVSPERLEAGARMTLFLASERVRALRTHGRLPIYLAEARVDTAGISYKSTRTKFELSTTTNGQRVIYRSTTSSAEFLGATLQVLTTSR